MYSNIKTHIIVSQHIFLLSSKFTIMKSKDQDLKTVKFILAIKENNCIRDFF